MNDTTPINEYTDAAPKAYQYAMDMTEKRSISSSKKVFIIILILFRAVQVINSHLLQSIMEHVQNQKVVW